MLLGSDALTLLCAAGGVYGVFRSDLRTSLPWFAIALVVGALNVGLIRRRMGDAWISAYESGEDPELVAYTDRIIAQKRCKLRVPRGVRARSLLSLICRRNSMRLIFDPVIADAQAEWQDAMVRGHDRTARWIKIRFLLTLAHHVAAHMGVASVKTLVKLWRLG